MPHQRIHGITAVRLERLKKSINKEREIIGKKAMTVPDIIESIVEIFETNRSIEIKRVGKEWVN